MADVAGSLTAIAAELTEASNRLLDLVASSTADVARIAELEKRVADLESRLDGDDKPEPDPEPPLGTPRLASASGLVVAGPAGMPVGALPRTGPAGDHKGAPNMAPYYRTSGGWRVDATRGTAPVRAVSVDELEIVLSAADWHARDGGGTGMHHQWVYAARPAPDITMEFWHRFDTAELGWTSKSGGFGAFSPTWPGGWDDFPTGDRIPLRTCLVRSCTWKYRTEDVSKARLQTVIKVGRPIQGITAKQGDGSPARFWPGAEGNQQPNYSGSVMNDRLGSPPIREWIGTRYVASFGTPGKRNGWLETWNAVDGGDEPRPWFLATRLTGIDWVQQVGPDGPGFNLIYFSWMFGGPSPEWAPNNPTRTGVRRFRDLAVKPGIHRPA